ncbi:MAG: hypothetical protein J6I95_03960 [Anaerotignum sp.]|nr:hypothetical protein [Anaerotignum sp.]
MTNDEKTESLLEKICYVIDILPSQMADFGRFAEIEEYYLQEKELALFAEKIVNIVIKIQGYHEFEIFCENWQHNVGPEKLAEMVKMTIHSKNGFLNMLCKKDNMLLSVHGQTLHMDIYNPTLAAIANLSMLASSEGLFMRRSEN